MYQEYLSEIDKVPLLSMWQVVILSFVMISICFAIVWFSFQNPFFSLFDGLRLLLTGVILGAGIVIFSVIKQQTIIDQIKESYKEKAPVEWVKESEEPLYSINVQEKNELQGSGGMFLNQISSKDFTDYRFVVKTENGYQLRTLSKQCPGLSEGDVYIQEKAKTVSPKIILEQYQYKEKEFNKVFGAGEKRVIFVVPSGTVQTKFEEGVIK